MAKTNIMQRNARLFRRISGSQGYAMPAPALTMSPLGVDLCLMPSAGLAYGRIVSMAREYPPPRKRER